MTPPEHDQTDSHTIVFTDIESSTRLWVEHPETASSILDLHDRILTATFDAHGGRVVKSLGDGLLALFPNPQRAMSAAAAAQEQLGERTEELQGAASVRIAIHCGAVEMRDGDILGLEVNRCQRIMSAAHGGQVLVSSAAKDLVEHPPPPLGLTELGRYRLRSLSEPETLHQLVGPGLRRKFPDLAAASGAVDNLPAPTSSFIGRVEELETIEKLLRGSRLVTLTGEGGVGKTRLALEVASRQRDRFSDGVWFIELDGLDPGDSVPLRVTSTLSLLPSDAPSEALADHFGDLTVLVILDNCDRVISGAAQLVDYLLARCPNSRLMTTSRERLAVAGEAVHRVPPMPVPGADTSAPAALRYDSVRLFSERAEAAAADFRLTERLVADVATVCRRLDGIPLAIELAAAKSAALRPDQIAEGLAHRLKLLDRTDGDAGRHRSLTAAVEWSFELLEPSERRLFEALSVFEGGFDGDAVAAVVERDQTDVLIGLSALADKSLISPDRSSSRFRMLEPIRAFAGDVLARTGLLNRYRFNHAQLFADVAEMAHGHLHGSDLGTWLDRLDLDHSNLRSAYDWTIEAGHVDLAARIAVGTAALWKHRGHAAEGRRRLEATLSAASLDDGLLAQTTLAAGDLAADLGDTSGARFHLEEARRLARTMGDFHTEAWALARLASIAHKEADLSGATQLFEASLTSARQAGEDSVLSHVLASLALLVSDRGDTERARQLAVEAVERSRATSDPYAIADALLTEAEIALNRGDITTGRSSATEAIELATREGLGDVSAWALAYLGWAAMLARDLRAGQALLQDAEERFEDVGTPMGRPWVLRHRAWGRWWAGEGEAALGDLRTGLAEAVEYVQPEAPMLVEVIAWILASRRPERSARLLGCSAAQREAMGLTLTPLEASEHDAVWRRLEETLGEATLERSFTEGRALGLADAAELAQLG